MDRYFTLFCAVFVPYILCFFSNLIHLYFPYIFKIFFLQFSLHVSDRLVHHQENQIARAASGTFPSFVVISCVAVGVNCKKKIVNIKENKSVSSWKRNKVYFVRFERFSITSLTNLPS